MTIEDAHLAALYVDNWHIIEQARSERATWATMVYTEQQETLRRFMTTRAWGMGKA